MTKSNQERSPKRSTWKSEASKVAATPATGAFTFVLSASLAVSFMPGMAALNSQGKTVRERIDAVRSAVQRKNVLPLAPDGTIQTAFDNEWNNWNKASWDKDSD